MRSRFLLLLPLLACTALGAQVVSPSGTPTPGGAAATGSPAPAEGRRNQKVERIRHEDAGSRIDEVRYGGQTESITVQPKAAVPEYEIQPPVLSRTRPADHRDGMGSANGQRFWNLFKF